MWCSTMWCLSGYPQVIFKFWKMHNHTIKRQTIHKLALHNKIILQNARSIVLVEMLRSPEVYEEWHPLPPNTRESFLELFRKHFHNFSRSGWCQEKKIQIFQFFITFFYNIYIKRRRLSMMLTFKKRRKR